MTDTEIVQDYSPNFEAWISDFQEWQTRIGFDPSWLGDYRFDIKFGGDTAGNSIEFGDFEGMPKWQRRMQIPQQNIRDAIISMVSVQGDTEFASVEQQNHLLATPQQSTTKRVLCESCAKNRGTAGKWHIYSVLTLENMVSERLQNCLRETLRKEPESLVHSMHLSTIGLISSALLTSSTVTESTN